MEETMRRLLSQKIQAMNGPIDFFNLIACSGLILSILTARTQAEDNKEIFTFDKGKLQFSKVSGYDIVCYGDLNLSQEIAAPQLPEGIVHLALPPGKDIAGITITDITSDTIEGTYDLFPVQPPQILSNPTIQFGKPDRKIYSSAAPFPDAIVRIAPQGYFAGYNVGALIVYPVQYIPSQRRLIFHSKIGVTISYKDARRYQLPFKETAHSAAVEEKAVREMVWNPNSLSRPVIRAVQSTSLLPNEEHEYVLITGDALAGNFQPLCDWKFKKGLSAKIVTTSWIYSNYSGTDAPEKIRNFIRDAHQNWGTLWVLLGGDVNVVPQRYAYAMDCQYGSPSDNFIPCDLYYSSLDGNWNANGNDTVGQIADSVDMYPDVFVGRASVGDSGQANAFVHKILTYEKTPPLDYETKALFLAMVLWSSPYTNTGVEKDYIDSMYLPSRFDPVTKLYQASGNETRATVIPAMNAGPSIVNHDGHASTTLMGIGGDYLTNADMDALTNGPHYSILYSIGCWPAAFDNDCIAEHFIKNPNGGGVAFIGNSRYGWGSPGNPLYGYSGRFDQQFFKKLFQDNIYHIGSTLAAAKAFFIPLAQQENVYRWCEYEINLLGDPEMPVWTDIPRTLTVMYPSELPVGRSLCPVAVSDGVSGVASALVCLMQGSLVYATGITGPDGRVNLEISTSDPLRPLYLTVTAQNAIPAEKTISLAAHGPYVCISSYSANGSSTGSVTPGDSVSMDLCLKNFGDDTARKISILLESESSKVTLTDSIFSLGALFPRDSAIIPRAFSFRVDTSLHNAEVAHLHAKISDSVGNLWTDPIGLIGATPVIVCLQHQISDSVLGNGNGYAEPGETVGVRLAIQNKGLQSAHNVSASLSSSDPGIRIIDSAVGLGNMLSGSMSYTSAKIAIAQACPVPSFPRIDLRFHTQEGYQYSDSFCVSVGIFGFEDDMESGPAKWTHRGVPDLWHLTSHRQHSGTKSWYCGDENPFLYRNNMADTLESIPVVLDQNSMLSFWCWYQFPNYGTDGFYVEANDGSGWVTLDFLGSGGALGRLNTGNEWLEYTYDLSRYPGASTIIVRFRFGSDASSVAEGAYIDDVKIFRSQPEIILSAESFVDYMKGWNMISVPRSIFDPLKTAIFPSVPSFAYGYSGVYQQQDTLKDGVGYWLKFLDDETVTIMGTSLFLDSVSVNPGWNMIGSISYPVPVTAVGSLQPGLIASNFFGYSKGYHITETIRPGNGYWVKVNQGGKLILSASGSANAKNRIKIVPIEELPPAPPDGGLEDRKSEIPTQFALEQNYPNPFNPTATIQYQLPVSSRVTLKICNVLGQVVQTLVDGMQDAGYKSVEWNASSIASGIYFYRLEATSTTDPTKSFTQVKKMLMIK
jgi:hypothetical protein